MFACSGDLHYATVTRLARRIHAHFPLYRASPRNCHMPKSSLAGHVASPALHTLLIRREVRRQLSPELFLPCPHRTIIALAIAATIVMASSTLIAVPQLGTGGIFISFLSGFL